MSKKMTKFLAGLTLLAILVLPLVAEAQNLEDRVLGSGGLGGTNLTELGGTVTGPGAIAKIVGDVIKVFLGVLGVIFVVLIIYAGFLWMTDLGDAKKAQKAKDLIKNAVIGIIIIFVSYGLTDFIIRQIIIAARGSGST